MKRSNIGFILFGVITVVLLCAMSAVVAYKYCEMQYAILYAGASAPASIAFLSAIPFGVGMIVTALLSWMFYKKAHNVQKVNK